jgi:hypothetical protein
MEGLENRIDAEWHIRTRFPRLRAWGIGVALRWQGYSSSI